MNAMAFNVAIVQAASASAATLAEAGNNIFMRSKPEDSCVEDLATGDRVGLRVMKGSYVVHAECDSAKIGAITFDSGAGVRV